MYKVCLTLLIMFICLFKGYSQIPQPDARITEVYGDRTNLMNAEQLSWLNNCLERTQVLTSSQVNKPEQNIKLLSIVRLQSKFPQPALPNPFSPETFNPLMYSFNYFDKKDQYFKVEGTDYIIKISGKDN